jgi:hypothetical protein
MSEIMRQTGDAILAFFGLAAIGVVLAVLFQAAWRNRR